MYESRFGITGPPFQLSPDPDFYFDSQAHRQALTVLREGLARESGCVVVSGEIGAGKTTLIRKLVGELETSRLALAHVVSTQLDADELLVAVMHGFGIAPRGARRKDLQGGLLHHVLRLEKQGCRAVLIIDEAQNLPPEAFAPLVSLATRTTPRRLPFQLCLVGQPELRTLLQAAELAKLREIVVASCHLGPLDEPETARYIEHRLNKVGWSGVPSFEPGAFKEIYRWSNGVPRRINLLCNRLMLGRFLSSDDAIDVATVIETERQLLGETGEPVAPLEPTAVSDQRLPSGAVQAPGATNGEADGVELSDAVPLGHVLCLAWRHGDYVQAAALMQAMRAHGGLPPATLVCVHDDAHLELLRGVLDADGEAGRCRLGVDPSTVSLHDDVAKALEPLLADAHPAALVVFDGTTPALAAASVARRRHVPVVHIGAGSRCSQPEPGVDDVARSTDAAADLLYTTDALCTATLEAEGMEAERIHCVGSLVVDAMRVAAGALAGRTAESGVLVPQGVDADDGYAVMLIEDESHLRHRQALAEIMAVARAVSRDIPVLWPMHDRVRARLDAYRLEAFSEGERIAAIPAAGYGERVMLLDGAVCVLTDSRLAQAEATALGIPCLTIGSVPGDALATMVGSNLDVGMDCGLATRALWDCLFSGGKRGQLPQLWDGRSGARIANFMAVWLAGALACAGTPADAALENRDS